MSSISHSTHSYQFVSPQSQFFGVGMDKVQHLVNETAGGILSSPYRLHPPEAWWMKQQTFLSEKCGYMLRPRYHPAWSPSWYGTNKNPRKCDDSYPMPVMKAYHWMDAIRMADGQPVMLKRVRMPPPNPPQMDQSQNTPQVNGDLSRKQSREQRRHVTRDRSVTSHTSKSQINGKVASTSGLTSNSNPSVRSVLEQKADHYESDPPEVEILNLLSSRALDLPTNYCSRLIDVFDVLDQNGDTTDVILVLPSLRPFNDPPFLTVAEGLDFIRQALDAVAFLHSYNIAHRDCGAASFMYDPSYIYPEGYHPIVTNMSRDLKKRAKHYSRTEYPPRYYITNFDHAKVYDRSEGVFDTPVFTSEASSVPEFIRYDYNLNLKHDPFATDVYLLGNLIKKEFLDDKQGFEFLRPLIESMTRGDSILRPKMKYCVERFFSSCVRLPKARLRKRFVSGPEGESEKILNSVSHIFRSVKYSMLGIPPAFMGLGEHLDSDNADIIEPFLWGKLGETTQRVSAHLHHTTASHRRSQSLSFSHAGTIEWKTEFARQQQLHRKQLEERAREQSLTSNVGTPTASRILLNHQPSGRKRASSYTSFFSGMQPGSSMPMQGNMPPNRFGRAPVTPTRTPVPAKTYVRAYAPQQPNGNTQTHPRNHTYTLDHTQPRTNTNDTDNTDTTRTTLESVSSVAQTQEMLVGNGTGHATGGAVNGNTDDNGILDADVSQLDLRQVNTASPEAMEEGSGSRTPRQERRRRLLEKELELKREREELDAAELKESMARLAKTNTVRSNESRDYYTDGFKIKKTKSTDTFRTKDTAEFKMMFPEPEALSPVLSPIIRFPPQGLERVASPADASVSARDRDVPASLLTGPAINKHTSAVSIPFPEIEAKMSPVDEDYAQQNGVGSNIKLPEAGREQKRNHKHENGHANHHHHHHHHHHHQRTGGSDSPQPPPLPPKDKKDRSTKWDCALCLRRLSTKAESIEHMRSEHSPYHVCLRCGSYYTTLEHLNRHKAKRRHFDQVNDSPIHAQKHKHSSRDGHYDFPTTATSEVQVEYNHL